MPATPDAQSATGDLLATLDSAMRRAIRAVLGDAFADADGAVRPGQNTQFGDFQSNAAMVLARQVKKNPAQLAKELIAALDVGDLVEKTEPAGPGFINFHVRPDALARLLAAMDAPDLGVKPVQAKHSIVIDLCGVNVAKQMHVGHLRAAIIGDALARVFERFGRVVHRENHLGDWGLPIAMVLSQLRARKIDLDRIDLDQLNDAYREAQAACKDDPASLDAAKTTLVRLQQGDPELLRDWHKIIDVTMREVYEAADVLNVKLERDSSHGESFYRSQLAEVVDTFAKAGLAVEDQGALVVKFPDRERPLLIRKSDGGFLYATTDLAAVRYRVQKLDGERVVYVVDARQRDHFKDVFDAAAMIGWNRNRNGDKAELVHLGFGAVLGKDKRPLKTRSGENFTLKALLEEAIERGAAEVIRRADDPMSPTHGLPVEQLRRIGQAVGIAAIKYADLGSDVVRDYVFDLDRMVAFEGDTGPYIQYAHARICSIFAKAGMDVSTLASRPIRLAEPEEKQLALMLLKYPTIVSDVARTLEPHRLCAYLYGLANTYSAFYQACPVLKADDESLRHSRLRLCDLTRRVLSDGLGLLGIESPARM